MVRYTPSDSIDHEIKCLEIAIKNGAVYDLYDILTRLNASIRLKNGSTPLHLACVGCKWEMVETLIDGGADVFAIDGKRRTPLDIARHYDGYDGYRSCVQLLETAMDADTMSRR
jgi:ankyrin repeat protein